MSQQTNNMVVDQINQNEPESPTKQKNLQNSSPSFSLSPKQESASRAKNETSPGVKKNKLDTLKKLIQKKLSQKSQILSQNEKLAQTLQQKQNEKKMLKQKIEVFPSISPAITSTVITEKQNQWKAKRQKIANQLQKLHFQYKGLQLQEQQILAKINLKKQENKKKECQKIAQKEFQLFELQKHLSEWKNKHSHNESSLQNTKNTLNNHKEELQNLNKKYQVSKVTNQTEFTCDSKLNELAAEQAKRQTLIQQLKDKILNLQKSLQQTEMEGQNSQNLSKLKTLKEQINELRSHAANLTNQINTQKRQIDEIVKNHKNQQKEMQKIKTKNREDTQKLDKLKQEKEQIQKLPKKVKYQQKPPQEYQQKKKQHQKIQKKIQTVKRQIEHQKKAYQNLIPPNIIEVLKAKITKAHQNNQKLNYFTKSNKQLSDENKKLDQLKQTLQWEVNPDIKINEANKQKEQTKSKFLEEQVGQIRKKSVQINNKLQEYVKTYPDFKPQKKQKKVQAPALVQTNSKNSSVKQEQKQVKKKKGGNSKQDSIIQQKQEKSPVHQIKNSPKKEEEKIEVIPKQVQKKASTNSQNGKSKKNKKNK